ncbi:hypothetical protein FXO38_08171 [Capsicum annuum]|nr:hypothetical protein FXO38_08171 [Capsicum annuum]
MEPPDVVPIPGRPKKRRNRQFYDTQKCGKMSSKGVYMTCSICHGQNHKKRGCPFKDSVGSSNVNVGPSDIPSPSRPRGRPRNTLPTTTTTTDAPPRPRGRLRKTSDTTDAPSRPRGRPRNTTPAAPAANVEHIENVAATARRKGRGVEHVATTARGRGRGVEHITASARVRGRGVEHVKHVAAATRESYAPPNRPASLVYAPPNPPASPVHAPPNSHASTGKRPKTTGIDILIAENDFTTYNPGLSSSSRILHTGSAHPIRSADITGDLDYKPKTGVRWRGKKAMTGNQLEVMRDEMRMNKRQKMASSQSKQQ